MDNIWTMVITLLGGLAFFLFGMHVMSSGLERLAGGRLEQVLKKMTSNTFKSFLLGLGITAAIQSSSAVTVMLVGLVNSGLMEIGQTIGVIMGSNIGTTVTAWILSLSEINSENPVINLLNPSNLSPIIALIGILLIMFSRKSRKKDAGSICIGFAVLMAGMNMMGDAVAPLAESCICFANDGLPQSASGRFGRRSVYGNHSELLRFSRNFTGTFSDGERHIRHGDPHHYGPEYRHLRYGADFQHRRK